MSMKSTAEAVWEHDLAKGSGRVRLTTGAAPEMPVSWSARTESSNGKTSPEELLAAAHAACYSMAFSAGLGRSGTPPDQLKVQAVATFEKVGDAWRVSTMELTVRGKVPGITPEKFDELARAAKDGCPISRALQGNVDIRLSAHLTAA